VLREGGYDPQVVTLAVDTPERPLAKVLAQRPEIALIDYTGSTAFGDWLEQNSNALVYTEKAGVNSVVIDSTADLDGMARNLAMSLSLYSGQMCTTPQNLFVPRDGILAGGTRVAFDDVVDAIVKAMDALLGDPSRAAGVLGAIATDATLHARRRGECQAGRRALQHRGRQPGVSRRARAIAADRRRRCGRPRALRARGVRADRVRHSYRRHRRVAALGDR
jgi:acyl-CoA reductase-like NAD-dependent aldehyde dehydrogenase